MIMSAVVAGSQTNGYGRAGIVRVGSMRPLSRKDSAGIIPWPPAVIASGLLLLSGRGLYRAILELSRRGTFPPQLVEGGLHSLAQ
jgi:hypothetical protein